MKFPDAFRGVSPSFIKKYIESNRNNNTLYFYSEIGKAHQGLVYDDCDIFFLINL